MFDKLYLEFGGKLIDDQHAARTLPGYAPDLKIQLLQKLKDEAEVILCINADAIEKSKIRADRLLTYENEILRLIEFLRQKGLTVSSVVITLYAGQKKADDFAKKLKDYKVKTYFHTFTKGYPPTSTPSSPTKATAPTLISKPPNLSSSSPLPAQAPANSPLPSPSSITNPNAAPKPAMLNSKLSQSGIYP